MCYYEYTEAPKSVGFCFLPLPPTQTPACFRAEAAETLAASAATAAAAAPALECVCGVMTAVCGGSSPEGWGWW